jgi:topoisomerase-4 subunit A
MNEEFDPSEEEERPEGTPLEEDDSEDPNGQLPVSGMYKKWFLEYASYVILERAVPAVEDGLKPVQRRILYSMFEMHDGRYHKVANIIGHTMQYHPHGDAAIRDAIVAIGQKELLIDMQGNWGDIRTGDSAAAPRYIEARLTPFALDVLFNHQTTEYQLSYDGRKNEPVTLPVKFPLLLAHGVEGIAVGLSTRILPHNFVELIQGSIDILKGKKVEIFPDFLTGGQIDISDYNGGERGGRVKVRAKIEEKDKKTLLIKEIPHGTTTTSVIDSILKANDKGKIKIKKVIDNTAKELEIEVQLPPNTSPDKTIDALYAFTDCEVSISPNACIIIDEKPRFITVNEILEISTEQTMQLLKTELNIKLSELMEKWHFSSLEKIFIEERIYRDIEECETWEAIIETIDQGLEPFKPQLQREVTKDDITRLTEIRIKRISRFDAFKADELIKKLEEDIEAVKHHLEHLVDYTINYFKTLLKKYGKGRERRTQITTFGDIRANVVAVANQKLYVNRDEGFAGFGLKKDEYVSECSDLDDIIVFREDGKYSVSKVSDKAFFGKNIIHIAVYRKGDDRMVYNVAYKDGESGIVYIKRFAVPSVTRDKEYDLTTGKKGSKIIYFTANPNGEAEKIHVQLHGLSKARIKQFDYDFSDLAIKGRNAKGNILTKYRLRKIELKEKGQSTIGGRDLWYEDTVGRLNTDERGFYLGSFQTDDLILVIYKSGEYELTNHELTNHYNNNQIYSIMKYHEGKVISAVYWDASQKLPYVKRFVIETSTLDKRFLFIAEGRKNYLMFASIDKHPRVELKVKNKKGEKETEEIVLDQFIDVKGWRALGNKITYDEYVSLKALEPLPEEKEENPTEEKDDASTENTSLNSENKQGNEEDDTGDEKTEDPSPEGGKTYYTGDQLNLL